MSLGQTHIKTCDTSSSVDICKSHEQERYFDGSSFPNPLLHFLVGEMFLRVHIQCVPGSFPKDISNVHMSLHRVSVQC